MSAGVQVIYADCVQARKCALFCGPGLDSDGISKPFAIPTPCTASDMIKRLGIVSLWIVGLGLIFVGINNNDPYLISLRGTPNAVLFLLGSGVATFLVVSRFRRGFAIGGTLLALVWC